MALTFSISLEVLAESSLKKKRTEKVWNIGNVFLTLISLVVCLLFAH